MVKSLIASELPIDSDVDGHLGSVGVRLRSVSRESCTVEHQRQVRVSSDLKLLFRWEGSAYTIPVRVVRSRIGTLVRGGMGYHTTVEFVQVPDEVEALIGRFMERRGGSSADSGQGSNQGIRP